MEELVCCYCHRKEVPATGPRRKAVKAGRPVFCDRLCAARYRRAHPNRLQVVRSDYWASPTVEAKFAKHLDPDYYQHGGFHHKWLRREWQGRFQYV